MTALNKNFRPSSVKRLIEDIQRKEPSTNKKETLEETNSENTISSNIYST